MLNNPPLYGRIQNQFIEKWETCPNHFPNSKKRFSYWKKWLWQRRFDHFLAFFKVEMKQKNPNSTEILREIKIFFREGLAYSTDQLNLIFSEQMIESTKDFIQKAWKFDPSLGTDEISQACRNVWVMLGLQALFGKPICITPSLLGYSLLYPYTDNFIDNPHISKKEKIEFCQRFSLKLNGKQVQPQSEIESRIYELVQLIESEFPRKDFSKVYDSLLAIHNAQTKSLQLLSEHAHLTETETFQIGIEKGASSVIADGYLVLGDLDENQLKFLYEYGAYLQILDDLQDAREDYQEGIMTCFSRAILSHKLDRLLCKTYHMGRLVLETITNLYPNEMVFHGLIKRSFGLLFIAAIFQNQEDYSPEFVRLIEKHTPFHFSFLHKRKVELEPIKNLITERLELFKAESTSYFNEQIFYNHQQ